MDTTEGLNAASWRDISWDAETRRPVAMDCRADPAQATVRQAMHLRLEYTPTGFDLPAGSEIGIEVPRIWKKHLGMAFRELHAEFDTDDERHPGGSFCLVTARAPEDSDAVCERQLVSVGFEFLIHVVIAEGTLRAGETLTVHLADPIGPACEAPKSAQAHPFRTLVRPAGQEHFQEVTEPPVVRTVGGPAAKLRLRCPAIVESEAEFKAKLCALDDVGENAAADYQGIVYVWRPGAERDAGMLAPLTSEQRLSHVPLKRNADRFDQFTAHDEFAGIAGLGNPIGTPEDFDGWRIFFGDIHCHSRPCDAFGTMRETYDYGQWVSGLDFCTVSHQQLSPGHSFSRDDWDEYLEITDEYDEAEDFATAIGAEVYCDAAHRIVYFPSTEEARKFPVARSWAETQHPTPEQMWEQLEGIEAMTVPHHTRFIWPPDWSRPIDPRERCVEICSRWGISEEGGPYSVQAALAMGHRLGFVGGTDNHLGQPGNGCFGVSDGIGITGALADELTREALYEAMWDRRCYATDGEPMLLYFSLADEPMGSEVGGWQGERVFTVVAAGTQQLHSVELLCNNTVIAHAEPGARAFTGELSDDRAMDDIMLDPHFDGEDQFCFYYVRARQADGAMAWASPIWLTP